MHLKAVFIGPYPNEASPKLAKWMGVSNEEFSANFVCVDLNPHSGEEFSSGHWRVAAQNMKGLLENRRVVLLGRDVAESFDLSPWDYEYFRFFDHPNGFKSSLFCVIPSPTGTNTHYSNQQNINRATGILQTLWIYARKTEGVS